MHLSLLRPIKAVKGQGGINNIFYSLAPTFNKTVQTERKAKAKRAIYMYTLLPMPFSVPLVRLQDHIAIERIKVSPHLPLALSVFTDTHSRVMVRRWTSLDVAYGNPTLNLLLFLRFSLHLCLSD